MIIRYELQYDSRHADYENLLGSIVQKSGLRYAIVPTPSSIVLFTQGEADETRRLYEQIGQQLPISLYLGSASAHEAPSFPDFANPKKYEAPKYAAAYPAVISGWLSGDDKSTEELFALMPNLSIMVGDLRFDASCKAAANDIVEKIRLHLLQNGSVTIQSGSKSFSLKQSSNTQEFDEWAMICDTQALGDFVRASESELKALCSMERPIVYMKPYHEVDEEIKLSMKPTVWAFLPNDPAQILVGFAASKAHIKKLYCTIDTRQDSLIVKVDGLSRDIPARPIINIQPQPQLLFGLPFDLQSQPSDTILLNLSAQNDECRIKAYRPSKAPLRLLDIKLNIENGIFEALAALGENEARLKDNLSRSLPELCKTLDRLRLKPNSLSSLICICALIVGIDESKTEYSLSYLDAMACTNQLEGGVKLDIPLVGDSSTACFDAVKLIQTMLSYKIAGVPDEGLAYSVFESLCEMLKDAIEQMKKSFPDAVLVLQGDVFSTITVSHIIGKKPFGIPRMGALSIALQSDKPKLAELI